MGVSRLPGLHAHAVDTRPFLPRREGPGDEAMSAIDNFVADGTISSFKLSNMLTISCLKRDRTDDCSRSYHCHYRSRWNS